MDGEMDWIAARFLLSRILGVHPLVVIDDAGRDDERFPVSAYAAPARGRVLVPAAVEAPEGVAGATTCAVCTDEVAAGQAVVRLPCAHWYHANCIAPWLRIRTTCPTCRAEVPREEAAMENETGTAGGRLLRREASFTTIAGVLHS